MAIHFNHKKTIDSYSEQGAYIERIHIIRHKDLIRRQFDNGGISIRRQRLNGGKLIACEVNPSMEVTWDGGESFEEVFAALLLNVTQHMWIHRLILVSHEKLDIECALDPAGKWRGSLITEVGSKVGKLIDVARYEGPAAAAKWWLTV